jgi:DNA-directed RNA polymerase specialized sigma24 family protein
VRTELDLESIVSDLYSPLYRFAFALSRNETQAGDLTQETFLILAKQQAQVRDVTKIKSWLFTTLRREFLRGLRSQSTHPEVELSLNTKTNWLPIPGYLRRPTPPRSWRPWLLLMRVIEWSWNYFTWQTSPIKR